MGNPTVILILDTQREFHPNLKAHIAHTIEMAYEPDTFDVYGLHAQQTIESHRSSILLLPGGVDRDPIRERGEEPIPLIDLDVDPVDLLPVAIIGAGKRYPHMPSNSQLITRQAPVVYTRR